MKLSILGGGGFRTPLVYEAVARGATGLVVDEVVIHDVDPQRLAVIEGVVQGLAQTIPGARTRVRATTELTDALTGADFVFCAIRVGGTRARTVDERVALDLGLLGQETVGPGGLAYALRTIPEMTRIARVITDVAPQAWVINFTNPAGIVTEAMRHVLGDRVVGICDTPIGLVKRVARALGIPQDRLDYDYLGINHLGWLRAVRADGSDRLPELMADDALLEQIEEARLLGLDWVRQGGCLPNEYLFYYRHTAEAVRRITSSAQTRGEFLLAQQGDFYREAACCASPLTAWRDALHEREATYMAESREEERREEDIAGGGYQEVALRLMTAIALDRPEPMILNVGNDSAVAGRVVAALPGDMVLEVPCVADGSGVHPRPVSAPTLGQLGLISQVRAAERCILTAALNRDWDAAWEGFSTHPLVDSPVLGRQLLAGYRAGHPEIAELFDAGTPVAT
ncbi:MULTISPECIES: family 4 glycosyl hydrolase [unclassified Luteococcus]|uniref:family 4 glycosyl hydrolase n=1 Tax=unclassified Luteococcus TaxID=2639923 RepID=UPI00313ED47B